MTDAQRTCTHCGAPLEPGAPGVDGLCPNCETALCPDDAPAPPVPHDPLLGQTLGDFEVLEPLGRGGMGAVYKAREASLDRLVALKVLPAGLASDSNFVVRFEREARAAAAVRHRSIVQIHGVGQALGHRYIAMEYIDGESLADVLTREGPLSQDRALAVMRPVLSAVAAAHEAGIVHRDIKPANLMFDARGDVRVTDFGLAKRTQGDVAVTDVGQSLGTPLYMAPEAATGGEATARSDLYSLGGTLYALLAGRPPFEGKTAGELILKHAAEAPPPLGELAPNVDPRLCTIIERLLRKDPDERYPSAQAVLDEIDALGELTAPGDAVRAEGRAMIGDAPTLLMTEGQRLGIEAAAQGSGGRHRRRSRRTAHVASVTILAVAAAIWAIIGLAGRSRQPDTNPPKTPVVFGNKGQKGDALEGDAEAAFEHARNAASMRRWSVVVEAVDRIEKEYGATDFYDANRTDIAALRAQAKARLAAPLPDDLPDDPPAPLAEGWVSLFDGKSLDGWRLHDEGDFARHGPVGVDEGRIMLGQGHEGTALVWTRQFPTVDYELSLEAMRLGGTEAFMGLVFPIEASHCQFELGRRVVGLATVDGRGAERNATGRRMDFEGGRWYRTLLRVSAARVEVWINDEKVVDLPTAGRRFAPWDNVKSISPFGVYTWGAGGALRNIRMRRLKPEEPPPEPPGAWVSLFDGKTLKGWKVVEQRDYAEHGEVRVDEGRIILAKGQPRTGIVWNGTFPRVNYEVALEARLEDGQELVEIAFPAGNSGCSLMVGGARGTLVGLSYVDGGTCADNGTGTPIALQQGRWYTVRLRVTEARIEAWVDDEPRVNMARAGRKVSLAHWLEPVGPFGIACALSTAGVRDVRMRRIEPGRPNDAAGPECRLLATLRGHALGVVAVAFSPDGTRIATGSQDTTVKLWDAADWQCRHTLRGHERWVESVAFSPDGKRLITSSMDGTVRVWDAATGACLKVLEGHTDAVHGAVFLPDGRRAVSAGSDGALRIWDAGSGKCLKTLTDPAGRMHVQHMALSADGKRLATGGEDESLRTWDLETGNRLRTVRCGSQKLWCVAFSQDGERVATVGKDPAIKIWSTDTGQLLKRLGTPRPNRGLAFSPDGNWIAAGDWNGSLQFWDAETYDRLSAVRGHAQTTFKIAFSPDGTRLASASFDRTAKVWALKAPGVALRPPVPAGDWIPLFDGKTLDGWRVPGEAFFNRHGDVAVVGGRVVLEAGRPCTGVVTTRIVPIADYEFSVEAMRVGGEAGFCNILFPVGTSHCTLLVGGRAIGLQTVDGREATDNPTTRHMKLPNGRWCRVRLRVTEDRIEAWVDDEQVVSITRAGHQFGLLGGYEPLLPLGIFSWESTSALRNMRLRQLKQAPPP